jgi:hypothetical protein
VIKYIEMSGVLTRIQFVIPECFIGNPEFKKSGAYGFPLSRE